MLTRRRALQTFGAAIGGTAVGGASLLGGAAPALAASAQPLGRLRPVSAFVDSVGVNTHLGWWDTPYGADYRRVRELLAASGVRHVRDFDSHRARDLAGAGVSTTVLVDSDMAGRGDPAARVRELAPLVTSGAVVAVEGPNEADLFWTRGRRTYRGQPFPAGAVAWQRDLHAAVTGDPRLRGLTVIGPSLGGTYWGGGNPYRRGELEAVSDWGNIHPYPAGNPYCEQRRYAGIAQYYADADFPSVALDQHPITLDTYRPPFGNRPMAATETGYSTWRWGQSERTQGLYTPRMFLENFRLGMPRTYAYELLDVFDDRGGGNREAHFGWLRHDLSPKPAYRAVSSLMHALIGGVPGSGQAGRALDATIAVTAAPGYDPAAVHHVALERPDGSVAVVLWHEVSSNDLTGLEESPRRPVRELFHPPARVSVNLGEDTSGVRAFSLTDSGRGRRHGVERRGTSVALDVSDRLTLLEIPTR